MSKGVQIAIASLSVFVALGWMMASSSEGSFRFFEKISQLNASDRTRETGLRIRGFVVDGTIERNMEAGFVDFAIRDETDSDSELRPVSDRGSALRIRYDGIDVPDLFRDGAEVVVEGGFRDGTFVASRIMAKCPSKYQVEPALPEQKA